VEHRTSKRLWEIVARRGIQALREAGILLIALSPLEAYGREKITVIVAFLGVGGCLFGLSLFFEWLARPLTRDSDDDS
jgi:hypothetical protein